MKYAGILLLAYLLLPVFLLAQAGSSCATPYNLTLDGVLRTYAASANTGAPVVCTYHSAASPVTWFQFTTSSQAHCPLFTITSPNNSECEVSLYTTCNVN